MRYQPFLGLNSRLFESQEEKRKKERSELKRIIDHRRAIVLESVEKMLANQHNADPDSQAAIEHMHDVFRRIPNNFFNS